MRQFLAVLQVIPLASFATYFIVVLGLVTAWPLLDHSMLIGWALALSTIASGNLILWWHYSVQKKTQNFDKFISRFLVFDLALAAVLYTCFSIELFSHLDVHSRVVLTSIIAAFTATGALMFASLPMAGILWSLCLVAATGIGILVTLDSYQSLGYLAITFGLFLCATVLLTSYKFVQGLIAETQIAQQGELISLLLHDFEQSVSDWLWEIDNQGFLQHVSVQLVDATNQSADELKSQTLLTILHRMLCPDSANFNAVSQLEHIQGALQNNVPFSELLLPVSIKQETRWWSFKAKPLFNENEQLTGWRGVTSDVTENRNRELEMIRLANQDSLTGLANRYQFLNSLNDLVPNAKDCTPCFLMMLDLDNFKNVNDSLGHHAGDQLLCHLATQLQDVTPKGALLARLGGDEFALIVTHIDKQPVSTANAAALASTIQAKLAVPFNLHGHKIESKISVGVSFAPDDATNANDLLNAADIALYQAKEDRNTVSFFSESLRQISLRKQRLLNDLQAAIEQRQFFLLYQPQYDLNTGEVVSFEALVRWQHPSLGLISPDDFIPLAESSRLIIPLGEWVLQKACCEAINWPKSISIGVNISAMQLEYSDLGKTVNKALTDSGLTFNRLELELTESSLTHNSPKILNMLNAFRAAGGQVAIDDFGTGFSSFSYLHAFPLDKLKIDRSFIDLLTPSNGDSQAQTIVNAIIQLSKALNLQVTAEGIETKEQQEILKDLTCHFGQGYLFSKPMTAAQVIDFISERR